MSELPKAATGIAGLDEITRGGFPRGRPTLVCGAAGCGKTVLALEFLVRGATEQGEPGVFVAFEETAEELAANVRSLGFDLEDLARRELLRVDHVHVERSEIEETGEYDLSGLFIRLGHAIDSIGAKRVALDTLETLFGGLGNEAIVRAELRRLLRWLKEKGVTAVVTAERGDGTLTRHGIEEYVSDCVVSLDHRVEDQRSTRRLRIVKYRGSLHGTDEYPFLIGNGGFSVLPATSMELDHRASDERVSTGVPGLDEMLGGGVYRGTTVLASGTAGTGKTSMAAQFAAAACERDERCLYLAFEESASQIFRNMRSIGVDLEPWEREGLLRVHAVRPTAHGLEMHLVAIHELVRTFEPDSVVVDPVSALLNAGTSGDAESMLVRLVDHLKSRGVTAFLTSLNHGDSGLELTDVGISSIVDTWILLRDIESGGERNRGMHVLKSRGMSHSNQIREFLLTGAGIELRDAYLGPEGVLTGSLRLAQEARERAADVDRRQEVERRQRELELKRRELETQVAALQSRFEAEKEELELLIRQQQECGEVLERDRLDMASSRKAKGADDVPRRAETGSGRRVR